MKRFLIPITVIICTSIAILCTACQTDKSVDKETMEPTIDISVTTDESITDEATTNATLPVITELPSTEPTTENTAQTEDGTVETYPNGMPIVAGSDDITRIG